MICVGEGVDILEECLWIRVDRGEYLTDVGKDYKLWVPNLDGGQNRVKGTNSCRRARLEFLSSDSCGNYSPQGEVNSSGLVQSVLGGEIGPWPIGNRCPVS